MDSKDRKIMACLQEDARQGYADIAKAVGLSSSAVHDRVRKLEKKGVIKAYRADIDLEQTGYPITAIVSIALVADLPHRHPRQGGRVRPGGELLLRGRRQLVRAGGSGPIDEGSREPRRRAPRKAGGNDPHHDRPLNAFRGPAR